ncbi:TetR/AcrR family transcriptional regulator [Microbacterium pygmaeum]|uniref:Regulatory protein, tetR family n=1 Tax=Microbacterium pygmaeum TaxID=370764 RepID=A0A1G7V079_9MICO|nr:TetR/AcrR family transcriptional regulator [Microbacterium pygmaeum]SDG52948.1 regulatory protein, tetR family [Microbacterium pygmaeum]
MSPYVSPLREAQAAQTRQRILDAAVKVFGDSGYSGTSLSLIAAAAGVSLETVKSHGPKAALLLASFDHAFSGAEGDGPLHARELGAQAAMLAPSELVPFLVDFVSAANARVARLWPRLVDAASGDPEVRSRLAVLQASRRDDMRAAIAMLRERGVCRSERADDELAAALSFLISPESHTQLVEEAAWTPRAYRAWILHAVERLILER